MGVELVTDREKKTPATETAALLVKRYSAYMLQFLEVLVMHASLSYFFGALAPSLPRGVIQLNVLSTTG